MTIVYEITGFAVGDESSAMLAATAVSSMDSDAFIQQLQTTAQTMQASNPDLDISITATGAQTSEAFTYVTVVNTSAPTQTPTSVETQPKKSSSSIPIIPIAAGAAGLFIAVILGFVWRKYRVKVSVRKGGLHRANVYETSDPQAIPVVPNTDEHRDL